MTHLDFWFRSPLSLSVLLCLFATAGCSDDESETCDPQRDPGTCVDGKARICDDGRWVEVEDGPCLPEAPDFAAECYSPTQNTDRAYDDGALGCACDPASDEDVCVDGAALLCSKDRVWQAVEDGPCFEGASTQECFSPTENVQLAQLDGGSAKGCSCIDTPANAAGFCVGGAGILCSEGFWVSVQDGPCWPPGLISPEMCEEKEGEVLAVPAADVSLEDACPDGRKILGAVTTDDGEAPCCAK